MENNRNIRHGIKFFWLLIAGFFLCGEAVAQSQDFLVLYKPGKRKRYYFHIGDHIALRPTKDFPLFSGSISRLGDSTIYIGKDSIHFGQIEYVFIDKNERIFPKNMALFNLAAGLGTVGIFQVASLVNSGALTANVIDNLYVVGVLAVLPVVVNSIKRICTKEEYYLHTGKWRLDSVIIPVPQ